MYLGGKIVGILISRYPPWPSLHDVSITSSGVFLTNEAFLVNRFEASSLCGYRASLISLFLEIFTVFEHEGKGCPQPLCTS